jgi:hypothetical protein
MNTIPASAAEGESNGDDRRICLCIVFNHNYVKNIPKLLDIYSARFRDIRFVVPFHRPDGFPNDADTRIIPVYEASHQFQGFIAQAAGSLADFRGSHIVFAADDLLLHPSLSERNLLSELQLSPEAAFIKSYKPLFDVDLRWQPLLPTLRTMRTNLPAEFRRELPDTSQALNRMTKHSIGRQSFGIKNLRGWSRALKRPEDASLGNLASLIACLRKRDAVYPSVMGYSDFVVVPKSGFEEFAHLCGVLAAMRVFVEVAIPTALLWTFDTVRRESDIAWKGTELWTEPEVDKLTRHNDASVARLFSSYGERQLYIHPIKLSKWRIDA